MGLGLSLQVAHERNEHPAFSRVFERTPVIVGRDNTVAGCVLPDERISRIHVSLDIRDGYIVARDAGSTNGTWFGTNRIPTDRWVAVGPVNATSELRTAEWTIQVTAREVIPQPVSSAAEFLVAGVPSSPPPPMEPASLAATMASPDANRLGQALRQVRTQIQSGPALRAARTWAQMMGLRNELVTALAEAIEALPPAERAVAARELVQQLPGVEREPGVRALLERNGVAPPHTLESASALALSELARWYVGQKRLGTPSDVFAFAHKLKTGIDELLLGILPMFSGLDRFEDQMALRGGGPPNPDEMAPSSRLPRSPREAASDLFDWTDRTDDAIRAIRTDIVDLTLHQTAVLNGIMRGVKQLLVQLSPEAIEDELKTSLTTRGALGRMFASFGAAAERWKVYRRRHGDLADEENEQFRVIFGPEFVAEYKSSSAEPTPLKPPTETR